MDRDGGEEEQTWHKQSKTQQTAQSPVKAVSTTDHICIDEVRVNDQPTLLHPFLR